MGTGTRIVAQGRNLVGRLKDLNYLQVAGNRFARGLSDIPAGMKGKGGSADPECAHRRPCPGVHKSPT
jgi:hypothetical protein